MTKEETLECLRSLREAFRQVNILLDQIFLKGTKETV
jgi:hypothetical protein